MAAVKLETEIPQAPVVRMEELKAYKAACDAVGIPVSIELKREVRRQFVLSELQRLEIGVYSEDRIQRYQDQQVRAALLRRQRMHWECTPLETYAQKNVVPMRVLELAKYIKTEISPDLYPEFIVEHLIPSEPLRHKLVRFLERARQQQQNWRSTWDPFLLLRASHQSLSERSGRDEVPVDYIAHWDEIDFEAFDRKPQLQAPETTLLLEKPKEEAEAEAIEGSERLRINF